MRLHRTKKPAPPLPRTPARRLAGTTGRVVLATGILLLALVGLLHLTRGTAVRHVRGLGLGDAQVAVGEPHFGVNVALLTGASLSSRNLVEIALDGDGTFERLWEDLRAAEQSITLQMYYSAAGLVADTLREILLERAAAGVQVLILYDAFGGATIPPDHVGTMRDAGIRIEPFRPFALSTLHLVQNRSHVRGIVVDGRIAWTGGFGMDDKWLGDGRTQGSWRETNVRFEGPAVGQMQSAFAVAWAEATGVLLTGDATFVPHEEGVSAGLLSTFPSLGSTAAERFLALSIASATRTLYITTAYFAPDAGFVDLLARAALRGVDVRILTAGPATDMHVVRLAGRGSYETLLEAGVRLYEWQPTVLHAKTFVIDGRWSTVGSMNFDNRSLALNDEATLMILDDAVGQRMDEVFLEDLRHSQEMTLEQFRQRPWMHRLGEFGAGLLTRLL
jgi:cardiolipin synthase A/B